VKRQARQIMQIKLQVELDIAAKRYLAIFAGAAKSLRVIAAGGLGVQFPGYELRKYLTHDGIKDLLDLYFDCTQKPQNLKRVYQAVSCAL
jgi:hypothetical protein